jgi:hypothetical protein
METGCELGEMSIEKGFRKILHFRHELMNDVEMLHNTESKGPHINRGCVLFIMTGTGGWTHIALCSCWRALRYCQPLCWFWLAPPRLLLHYCSTASGEILTLLTVLCKPFKMPSKQ